MVKVIDHPKVEKSWRTMEGLLLIHNKQEYERAVATLNLLLDKIGDNEEHPLFGLLEVMGTLIECYEQEHYDFKPASGAEALKFLM